MIHRYCDYDVNFVCFNKDKEEKIINIDLCISSFKDVDATAIHYYGYLKSQFGDIRISSQLKIVDNIQIELYRPITENDLKQKCFDDTFRFAGYKIGDTTNAFNSVYDLAKKALQEFDRIFIDNFYLNFVNKEYEKQLKKEIKKRNNGMDKNDSKCYKIGRFSEKLLYKRQFEK